MGWINATLAANGVDRPFNDWHTLNMTLAILLETKRALGPELFGIEGTGGKDIKGMMSKVI